jgi:hypothetical protein
MNDELKIKILVEKIKKMMEESFSGNIKINFDKGTINNRINITKSKLLIDK